MIPPASGSASRLHGALFDVGHTLMDESARLAASLAWVARAVAERGVATNAADLARRYRDASIRPVPGMKSLLVQILMELGLGEEAAWTVRNALPWDAVPLEAYPDACDAVRRLREAGLRVGVLANQPASAQEDLERAGLAGLFDDIWLSDAVGLAKPDPAFFEMALRAWGIPPARIAYVGDRPDMDTKPAKALGLHTVRVRTGPHADFEPEDPRERADFDAKDLAEAAAHLLEWARG
ncbi:MAG: HAD family hydrolase [Planctomycetes bacterium]|nr:HAD family hydrolase [Planctomycetota bacterium]